MDHRKSSHSLRNKPFEELIEELRDHLDKYKRKHKPNKEKVDKIKKLEKIIKKRKENEPRINLKHHRHYHKEDRKKLKKQKEVNRKGLGADGPKYPSAILKTSGLIGKPNQAATESHETSESYKNELKIDKVFAGFKMECEKSIKAEKTTNNLVTTTCVTTATGPVLKQEPNSSYIQEEINASFCKSYKNSGSSSFVKQQFSASFSNSRAVGVDLLEQLTKKFQTEIEILRCRLEQSATQHNNNHLIVATIRISNENILRETFDFLKFNLIHWIGLYQNTGWSTPIFYDIIYNISHINVVCQDLHAYFCLQECSFNMRGLTGLGKVRVTRMPSISSIIYYYEAVFKGVYWSSVHLLQQIRLHGYALDVENWLSVCQEISQERNESKFLFIIDERSAISLNYYYNNILRIYMSQLTFRNLGLVPK